MKHQNSHINEETFLAQWLEGNLSDTELKNRISEADYNVYLKLRKGLHTSDKLNASTQHSFNKIQQKIANKKTPIFKLYPVRWSIGIAASIVFLFGLFSILGNNDIIYETNFGETKTITLLDDSQVILNSKSTIVFNENDWKKGRQLTLDGEAYFKVEKGNTFTVNTNNGSVTVLGTQFNVNSTNDFFDVVCYEGKVSVTLESSEHILLPTERIRKINGNPSKSSYFFTTMGVVFVDCDGNEELYAKPNCSSAEMDDAYFTVNDVYAGDDSQKAGTFFIYHN